NEDRFQHREAGSRRCRNVVAPGDYTWRGKRPARRKATDGNAGDRGDGALRRHGRDGDGRGGKHCVSRLRCGAYPLHSPTDNRRAIERHDDILDTAIADGDELAAPQRWHAIWWRRASRSGRQWWWWWWWWCRAAPARASGGTRRIAIDGNDPVLPRR